MNVGLLVLFISSFACGCACYRILGSLRVQIMFGGLCWLVFDSLVRLVGINDFLLSLRLISDRVPSYNSTYYEHSINL